MSRALPRGAPGLALGGGGGGHAATVEWLAATVAAADEELRASTAKAASPATPGTSWRPSSRGASWLRLQAGP